MRKPHMSVTPSRRRSRGVATVELLIGAALGLLVAGAVQTALVAQTRALAWQQTYARSQDLTRAAMELMTRELRLAGYNPAGAIPMATTAGCDAYPRSFVWATTTGIMFQADLNGDGDIWDAREYIAYWLSGDSLVRWEITQGMVTLISGIPTGGMRIRYYRDNWPPSELTPVNGLLQQAQRDCISKVRIQITSNLENPNPDADEQVESVAQTEVFIRSSSMVKL